MPDPLSVTVSVASLVATAVSALQTFNTYCSKYNYQNLAAISIKVQCDCIHVALNEIQAALLSNQNMAARLTCDDSFSGRKLNSVLGACELTFAIVVGRLSKLNGSVLSGAGAFSRRARLERLWNESDILELSQNISRLSDGLNLLLTALNTKSLLEVQRILTSPEASVVLDRVADDASSIHTANCNDSFTSAMTESDPLSHAAIDPKYFTFDQEILMTPAYRKVQNSLVRSGGTPPPLSSLPIQNGPNHVPTNEPGPRKIIPLVRDAVVNPTHSSLSPMVEKAADTSGEYSQCLTFPYFLEPIQPSRFPAGPQHAALVSRESASKFFSWYSEDSEDFSTLPTKYGPPKQLEEKAASLKPRAADRTKQTRKQRSADHRTLDELTKAVETQLDNPNPLSDHNIGFSRPPKQVTLADFMPECSQMQDAENAFVTLSSFVNLPERQNQLYITNTEVHIIDMGLADLPDNGIIAVQDTIKSLFLYQNRISKLPQSISACQNLEYLNLTENNLTKFPLEVCSIKSLRTLALAVNGITEIPIEIQNLINLEFFNVASNRLRYLPTTLMHMDKLTIILAHGNLYINSVLQKWQEKYRYTYDSKGQRVATRKLKKIMKSLSLSSSSHLLQNAKTGTTSNSNIGPETERLQMVEIESTTQPANRPFKWPESRPDKSSIRRARARWAPPNHSYPHELTSDSEGSSSEGEYRNS